MSPEQLKSVVSSHKSTPGVETGSEGKTPKGNGEGKPQSEKPKMPNEPAGYIKKGSGDSKLFVHKNCLPIVEKGNKNTGCYTIYVTINGKEHTIMADLSPRIETGEYISFPIQAIRTQDNKTVNFGDLLGLDNGTKAEITRISEKPFPEAEASLNGGQPNQSVTNPNPNQANGLKR